LRESADRDEAAERQLYRELEPAAMESLCCILARGDRPTIGWWRRNGGRPADQNSATAQAKFFGRRSVDV
jgi:hypothetical protein